MQGQLLSLSPIVGTIHELRKQLSQTTEKPYKYVPLYIAKKVAPPCGMWSRFPCRSNPRQWLFLEPHCELATCHEGTYSYCQYNAYLCALIFSLFYLQSDSCTCHVASTFPIFINEDDVKLCYYRNKRKSFFGEECQLKKSLS